MKFANKALSLILVMVMLFGAAGLSASDIFVVKSTAATTTKATQFNKKTVKLKSVIATVNGPKLTWDKLTGSDKYYVYRKTQSTAWKKIATVKNSVATYTDTSVKNNTAKYFYTVKGVDKKGVVSQYNKTGLVIYFVKAPVVGAVTNVSNNGVKVTWTKVNNATGYYVYRKKADGKFVKIATVKNGKTVSYTDKSSKISNTVYYYTVKAYKTVSGKTYSSAYNTNGKYVRFLKAPVLKKATLSGNDYMISWEKVAGATEYIVYRSNNLSTPSWKKIGTTTSLKFRDKNVRGKTYLYTVKALRNSVNGSFNSKGVKVYFKAETDYILANPLAAYQKAAKEINQKGIAGYKKKNWQALHDFYLSDRTMSPVVQTMLEGFLVKEDDAEVRDSVKGSDDAKRRMQISNCSKDAVRSVTAQKSGSNYIVTIVMKSQTNPSPNDTDGINVMSRDILYMEDVVYTVENDQVVKKIISGIENGEIHYKDYTITAIMTPDGKFVEINHYCSTDFNADLDLVYNDSRSRTKGKLDFCASYTDFVY